METDTFSMVRKIIADSDRVVFFGGAGVSTASAIPDFRSPDGLYNQTPAGKYSQETMLSHHFFIQHPQEFYENLRRNMLFPDAQPNAAHIALAKLEKQGKLRAIITQNIDGLHQKAGSENVIELHGNIDRFYCTGCQKAFHLDDILRFVDSVPKCDSCGAIIRPDVVLYEETLDQEELMKAVDSISHAEVLIVGGTSLVVYPAAGLLQYYSGDKLILVNRSVTPYDQRANYVLHGDISKVLPELIR